MRSVRRWLSVEWRSRSWQDKKNKKPWKRWWEERRATCRAGRTDRQTERGTKREWKRNRERKREKGRGRGLARVRGRTGTRGIQQLPLNVFNAAVEARKRSVGRSHRSAPRRSRWGWNRVGRPECSRFMFLVDFSLSLYVPGGIAIAGPVKHGRIQTLRLCEFLPCEKHQRRWPTRPANIGEDGKRAERETVGWRYPMVPHSVDNRKNAHGPGLAPLWTPI